MRSAALLSATLVAFGAFAEEMRLNPLFSDNMVFVAGKPLRVFGNGDGDAVVRIGGREARAQSADGSWVVELPGTLNAGKAYVLEVVLNGKPRTLHSVRMGEVWLMSGQSNMQFKLKEESGYPGNAADDSDIACFNCKRPGSPDRFGPQDGWVAATKDRVGDWSAIGWLFARERKRMSGLPIGIVCCCQGASTIQAWLPNAVASDDRYQTPSLGMHADHFSLKYHWNRPFGQLYETMFRTVVPYSFSGVVWYQGESNTGSGEATTYGELLRELVQTWRRDLQDFNLPFLIIQIADYDQRRDKAWKALQDMQAGAAEAIPCAKHVCSADVCESADIHPRGKTRLARRLALRATEGLSCSGSRRYRGAMSPYRPTEADLRDLAAEGANLLRYQMTETGVPHPPKIETEAEELDFFDAWSKVCVDRLVDEVLPWSRKCGLKVVVDLHTSPGRRDNKADCEVKMYHNAAYAQRFVDFWRETARRCQPFADVIYGYDLFNEPQQNQHPLADCDYWTLQERAAKAIREVDAQTPVVVSGRFWDMPHGFAELKPFADPNVIYQAHMYAPHEFTHQFVSDWCTKGLCSYPGIHPKTGRRLDVELLKRVLRPVRDFQLKQHARIFIGEFSAVAWASGADRYLSDCISLFEEYGWDWTYHAWREWAGWSVEHVCTDFTKKELRRASVVTERQKVLRDGFKGVARRTKPLSAGTVKSAEEPMPVVMPLGGR